MTKTNININKNINQATSTNIIATQDGKFGPDVDGSPIQCPNEPTRGPNTEIDVYGHPPLHHSRV